MSEPIKQVLSTVNFPFLSPKLLGQFAAEYTPDMGVTELRHCQQFYLREARRDPTPAELSFLNTVVSHRAQRPENILISELKTDEKYLAETFADLMAKRAALEPDYTMPPSLVGVPAVARGYLAAIRQNAGDETLTYSCRAHSCLSLAAEKKAVEQLEGDAAQGLAAGVKRLSALLNHEPLLPGDRLYVLLGSTDPVDGLEEKLIAFASSPNVLSRVKKCLVVGADGLLFPLIELGHGFSLDLPRLYGADARAERLLDTDLGLVLIARASDAADMLTDALDAGLRPRLAGQLLADGQIAITNGSETNITFSVPFFRALFLSRAYRAEVKPHDAAGELSVRTVAAVTVGGIPVTGFCAEGQGGSPYQTAVAAALAAVSGCVARGGALRDIRIAETVRLPLADVSAGNLGNQLALLLGLYRVETELALNDTCTDLRVAGDSESKLTFYAMLSDPEEPTPDSVVGEDTKIYLLEPAYTPDGIPDFDDLKKMYSYIGKLKKDGILLAACAVTGDVTAALSAMNRDSRMHYLRREPLTAKPGSILVQATVRIQGTLLAGVSRPEPIPEPIPEPPAEEAKEEDNA